jgi:hypothetical protein
MQAFDGTWHPGNGWCLQELRAGASKKGKYEAWEVVTNRAKHYDKDMVLAAADEMEWEGKTVRVLRPDGTLWVDEEENDAV